jgi:prefoldin subunit 5
LQNIQQISNKIENCSEILQNLAKEMGNVSNQMTAVQEHSLVTENATLPEDAESQDK